jgi:hypothetical protein
VCETAASGAESDVVAMLRPNQVVIKSGALVGVVARIPFVVGGNFQEPDGGNRCFGWMKRVFAE